MRYRSKELRAAEAWPASGEVAGNQVDRRKTVTPSPPPRRSSRRPVLRFFPDRHRRRPPSFSLLNKTGSRVAFFFDAPPRGKLFLYPLARLPCHLQARPPYGPPAPGAGVTRPRVASAAPIQRSCGRRLARGRDSRDSLAPTILMAQIERLPPHGDTSRIEWTAPTRSAPPSPTIRSCSSTGREVAAWPRRPASKEGQAQQRPPPPPRTVTFKPARIGRVPPRQRHKRDALCDRAITLRGRERL
jgi:hypothetical protein